MANSGEPFDLFLPSDDSEESCTAFNRGPLGEWLPVAAAALQRPTNSRRFACLITDASRVQEYVKLLRSAWQSSNLVVGDLSDCYQHWLMRAVDVVVGSPEQVQNFSRTQGDGSTTLKVLLLDAGLATPARTQALKFAGVFQGFKRCMKAVKLFNQLPYCWYPPQLHLPMPPAIQELVGPGRWDYEFLGTLLDFTWDSERIAVQEWSDLPVFLVPIIRDSLTCEGSRSSLVFAPKDKVETMIKLLRVVAAQLGFTNICVGRQQEQDTGIVVECPGELVELPNHLDNLLVIEAEKLLEDPASTFKIQRLVEIFRDSRIGVHFSSRSSAVEELLQRLQSQEACQIVQGLKLSMHRAGQFSSLVQDESEKVDRVCDVLNRMIHPGRDIRWPVVIFCNSGETAEWLAGGMRERGVASARSLRDWDEFDPKMFKDRSLVLVTSVYQRTVQCDVINFELPDTYDEYVERVGCDRDGPLRPRMVINVATSDELSGFPPMLELPAGRCSRAELLPLCGF